MFAIMEERAPVANENAITPIIIRKTATIFSIDEMAVISP